MPVSIIENFQLGTNLPLDARYVVGHPNDVSLYWYDGMLIYNASTNQLFVVKDTSAEIIKEILDSSSNIIISIDQSLNDLQIYIDGSLYQRDLSINALFAENDIQDASIIRIDSSLVQLNSWSAQLDASIIRIDSSINALFLENDIQDASIIRIDISLGQLNNWSAQLDASIQRIDASLYDYVRKDGDTMTGPLILNSSLNVLDNATFLSNVDIGGNLRVDGSTTFLHTDVLDVSTGWIRLNTGLTGIPPEWLQSGIIVERGDASSFAFIYDETRQEFRIGIVGISDASGVYDDSDTQAVATREDVPVPGGIPSWNSDSWRFDTSTSLILDVSTIITSYDISINAKLKTEEFNVSGIGFPAIPGNGDLFYRRDLYQEFVYDSSRGKWITTNRATYTCGRSTAQKNATVYMGIADAVMSSAQGLRMPRNGVITAVSIDNANIATVNRVLDIRVNNSTTNRIQLTVGIGTKGAYSIGGNLNFAANDLIQAVLLPNGVDNFNDILVSFEVAWRE